MKSYPAKEKPSSSTASSHQRKSQSVISLSDKRKSPHSGLVQMANQGKHALQLKALEGLFNSSSTIQKQGLEEEEPMQGKFDTAQKMLLEEEEPLQGKFETLQKQGLEEEELMQGKFKIIQKQGPEEEELIQGKFKAIQKMDLEEEEPLQGKFDTIQRKENNTGLPDNLKSGIENLSGFSMDDVKVHYNSDKPATLQAHAYAQGTDIHLASGQEKHLPHEAWHVVQQKQGRVRPTIQLQNKVNVNDDAGLEKEADVMGGKAIQYVQSGGESTIHFVNNRPNVFLQRKLQVLSNKRTQSVFYAQLKSNSQIFDKTSNRPNTNVIQLNKHTKRILNVLTLGIRKAYTYNKKKKMANAVQNIPQPQEPANSPEDDFVTAYEKSRYYHQTGSKNLPSIEQHGLLNYADRGRLLPENVIGMSRLGGDFEGDEKKGVFLGPKKFMKENKMTENVARAFMPADRTKLHHWTEEKETPPDELYRDEKFRGGAVITKNSIPPEQITSEKMSDLLENDAPKLKSILKAVASQYEGEAPNYEVMKDHLLEAINKRRLSNVPFDNI